VITELAKQSASTIRVLDESSAVEQVGSTSRIFQAACTWIVVVAAVISDRATHDESAALQQDGNVRTANSRRPQFQGVFFVNQGGTRPWRQTWRDDAGANATGWGIRDFYYLARIGLTSRGSLASNLCTIARLKVLLPWSHPGLLDAGLHQLVRHLSCHDVFLCQANTHAEYIYRLINRFYLHLRSTPSVKKKSQILGFRANIWLSVLYEIFL
jgi:hypothetical protein